MISSLVEVRPLNKVIKSAVQINVYPSTRLHIALGILRLHAQLPVVNVSIVSDKCAVYQVADKLADAGFVVSVPDFWRGKQWPMEKFPPKPEDDFMVCYKFF